MMTNTTFFRSNDSELIKDPTKGNKPYFCVEVIRVDSDDTPLPFATVEVSAPVAITIHANGKTHKVGPKKRVNLSARGDGGVMIKMAAGSIISPAITIHAKNVHGGTNELTADSNPYARLAGSQGNRYDFNTLVRIGVLPKPNVQGVVDLEIKITRAIQMLGRGLARNAVQTGKRGAQPPASDEEYNAFFAELEQPWFVFVPKNDPENIAMHFGPPPRQAQAAGELIPFDEFTAHPNANGAGDGVDENARGTNLLKALGDLVKKLGNDLKKWIQETSKAAFKALKGILEWCGQKLSSLLKRNIFVQLVRWLVTTVERGVDGAILFTRGLRHLTLIGLDVAYGGVKNNFKPGFKALINQAHTFLDALDPDTISDGSLASISQNAIGSDPFEESKKYEKYDKPAAKHNAVADEAYWSGDTTRMRMTVSSSALDTLLDDLRESAKKIGGDIKKLADDVVVAFKNLFKSGDDAKNESLKDFLRIFLDMGHLVIDVADALGTLVLDLILCIIDLLKTALTAPATAIPFFSDRFKKVTGDEMLVMDLFLLPTMLPLGLLYTAFSKKPMMSKAELDALAKKPIPEWQSTDRGVSLVLPKAEIPAAGNQRTFSFDNLGFFSQLAAIKFLAQHDLVWLEKPVGTPVTANDLLGAPGLTAFLPTLSLAINNVINDPYPRDTSLVDHEADNANAAATLHTLDIFTGFLPVITILFDTKAGVRTDNSVEKAIMVMISAARAATLVTWLFRWASNGNVAPYSGWETGSLVSKTLYFCGRTAYVCGAKAPQVYAFNGVCGACSVAMAASGAKF